MRWFFNILAGLRVDAGTPGFKRFYVRPHFLGDLSSASASLETVRGKVAVAWQRADGVLALQLTVPTGSIALLSLPAPDIMHEGDRVLWDVDGYHAGISGIRAAHCSAGTLTIEVGGGHYRFTGKYL